MALSGHVTSGTAGTGGQSYFRVDWTATQDAATNKSTVNWTLTLYCGTNIWRTNAVRIDYVKINGTEVKSSTTYSNKGNGSSGWSEQLASGTIDITHDSSGAKSFSIQLSGWFYQYGTRTGSQTFTLDTIPRASGITASNANFGAVSNIKIDKKSTSFTTTVSYKASGQSSYTAIKTKTTDTSIAWTIPTSLYSLLGASNKTLSIILQCITYSGSTQIGDAQTTTITATATESACKPTVSTSIAYDSATNNLTGVTNKGIKNFSTATITITATGQYNATISSKKVTLGGVTKTSSYSFTNLGDNKYTYEVTDSRGFKTTGTVNLTVVNYIKPTCIIEATPPDATSGQTKIKVKGDFFNGSFGSTTNTLKVWYGYKEATASSYTWVEVTPTKSNNTYSATASVTLDYTKTYKVQASVRDATGSSYDVYSKELTIKTQPIISWSKDTVTVNGATTLNGNSSISGTLTTTGRIFGGNGFNAPNNKYYTITNTSGSSYAVLYANTDNDCVIGTNSMPTVINSSARIEASKAINAPSLAENGTTLANKYQAKGNYLTNTYVSLGNGTASSTDNPTITDSFGCSCYIIAFKAESQWWAFPYPKGFLGTLISCKGNSEYWSWKLAKSGTTITVSRGATTAVQFYLYGIK